MTGQVSRLGPEPRPVADDEQDERREPEADPEEDREGRRRGVHLAVLEIGQALAAQPGPPDRRTELCLPFGLRGVRLEPAIVVGAVQLERHRSDRSAAAKVPAPSGDEGSPSSATSPSALGPEAPPGPSPAPGPDAPPGPSWPSSHRSISCVNETSLEKSAPTDSPRWMRLIASPMSGATDRTVSLGLRFEAGSGTESVMTTSRSELSRIRSKAGSLSTPCVA